MARPKKKDHPYVGRGGLKLEAALKAFAIDVKGRIALDVGSSTGGFTDCLLQNGAEKVYAIDVGYGILDWKLRKDHRVKVLERTNVRYLTPDQLYASGSPAVSCEPLADLAVIDVSFISLTIVLPVVWTLLADKAEVIALIKPQFEAKREDVERGGIVRSEGVRNAVIEKVKVTAEGIGFNVKGLIDSPITGADGPGSIMNLNDAGFRQRRKNVEYLICLEKNYK